MPAEAIHLSALADTAARIDAEPARLLRVWRREARLGAVLVDLPYFERFPVELLRHVTGRPAGPSRWGDLLHQYAPAWVGLELLRAAARASRRREALAALALGYVSHCAVDWSLHPLVNRLARARSEEGRGTIAAQHREVEKFQSILFHERRHGRDFMGTPALLRYIDVDGEALLSDITLVEAVRGAVRVATGGAPAARQWTAWAAGYRQYCLVLGSPFGRLPAPPRAKARERGPLYLEPEFERQYAEAVARSCRYVSHAYATLEGGRFEAPAYFATVLEGSIDDPPPWQSPQA